MAVQKSKKSKSKKKIKNQHKKYKILVLSFNKYSKELHLRHHITPNGKYKNKIILNKN